MTRELLEETGLSVSVGPLLGIVTRPAPHGVYTVYDYACRVRSGTIRAGDDAVDVRWVTAATFATLELTEGLAEALSAWNCLPGA